MLFSHIGILSAVISVVAATDAALQLILAMPACAQTCIIPVVLSINCNISTVAALGNCLCPDVIAERSISKCVQQNCTFTEQLVVTNANSALCVGQPVESLASGINLSIYIGAAVTFPLIFMRLGTRAFITKRVGWDDGVIVLATLCLAALLGIMLELTHHGLGKHIWNVDTNNIEFLFKAFYIGQILYISVQVFAKISILISYLLIFPQRWFRWTCFTTIAFLALHGTAYILVIAFQCMPVSSIWDHTIQGKCLNQNAILYSGAVFSIVEDVGILILPIPLVANLHIGKMKKFNLTILFSLGSFACVASILRLKRLTEINDQTDGTYDNGTVTMWSAIELCVALVCAALFALRPLLSMLSPRFGGSTSRSANSSKQSDAKGNIPLSARSGKLGISKVNTLQATFRDGRPAPLPLSLPIQKRWTGSHYEILSPSTSGEPSHDTDDDTYKVGRARKLSASTVSSTKIIIMKPRRASTQSLQGRVTSGLSSNGTWNDTVTNHSYSNGNGNGNERTEGHGMSSKTFLVTSSPVGMRGGGNDNGGGNEKPRAWTQRHRMSTSSDAVGSIAGTGHNHERRHNPGSVPFSVFHHDGQAGNTLEHDRERRRELAQRMSFISDSISRMDSTKSRAGRSRSGRDDENDALADGRAGIAEGRRSSLSRMESEKDLPPLPQLPDYRISNMTWFQSNSSMTD